MANQIIALDLGGTQIRAARYDLELNLLQRENTLTRAELGVEPTIERMKAYIRKVMGACRADILGIGISAPGPLNPFSGVIVAPPNLPGWLDVPLREIMEAEFDLPVFIGNDANVAALAEASKGAAQGCRHMSYITVSTGIGAGVICDGRLLLGREGLAAEFGHIPIVLEQGKVSSVELEAAGPAIARRVKRALEAGAQSKALEIVDGDLKRVDAKAVGQAAAAGDPPGDRSNRPRRPFHRLGHRGSPSPVQPRGHRHWRRRRQDRRIALRANASGGGEACDGRRLHGESAHRAIRAGR